MPVRPLYHRCTSNRRQSERPRFPHGRQIMDALLRTRQPVRIVICPNCSLSLRGAALFLAGCASSASRWRACSPSKGCGPCCHFREWKCCWSVGRCRCESHPALSLGDDHSRRTPTSAWSRVIVPSVGEPCSSGTGLRLELRRPASRLHPSRLTIESHGRQCELGKLPRGGGAVRPGAEAAAPDRPHR